MAKNLTTMLFENGSATCRLTSDKKTVGKSFPAGVSYSAKRPASARRAVKVSGICQALDSILIDRNMNFIQSIGTTNSIYVEYEYDGKKYEATYNGKDISYSGDAPSGYGLLYPILAYALSDCMDDDVMTGSTKETEFKKAFADAVNEYDAKGSLENTTIARLFDSFYYEIAQVDRIAEFEVFEEDLATATIKQGYVSGHFDDVPAIEDMDLTPISILEGVEKHSKKTSKKSKGKSVSEELESWINGDATIPYEWSEEQKARIPSREVLNDFVPNEVVRSLVKKCQIRAGRVIDRMEMGKTGRDAIGKDYINCRIVGKPGTGKTTLLYALAAILGVPIYTVPITKNTEEDTFQGMTKVVEGNFQFVPTDFLEAYKNGGIVVLEEGNLADPSVMMGALGQAIEAPFVLNEDGYKTVNRHPLFMCFLTMNVNTYGSKDLNEALASRFRQTFMLDDPTKEEFVSILEKYNSNTKLCNWIYESYQKILNYLTSPSVNMEEMCLNVTLRGCIGALECIEEETAPKQALKETLVGAIGAKELELARNLERDVIDSLPNISI